MSTFEQTALYAFAHSWLYWGVYLLIYVRPCALHLDL